MTEATSSSTHEVKLLAMNHIQSMEHHMADLSRNVVQLSVQAHTVRSMLLPFLAEGQAGQERLASQLEGPITDEMRSVQELMGVVKRDMIVFAAAKARNDMLNNLV